MKRRLTILFAMLMSVCALTGCDKKKEEAKALATETYVEENEVQVVYHDTENVDFRIAVIEGEMSRGYERLMEDAAKEEAANKYRFYKYSDFSNFHVYLENGMMEIAVISLKDALAIEEEKPGLLCLLAINGENEEGYYATVAKTDFVKMYPFAVQVFLEEMQYSSKEEPCILGEEMKMLVQDYLTENELHLVEDGFYYPLPEVTEEVIDTEASE